MGVIDDGRVLNVRKAYNLTGSLWCNVPQLANSSTVTVTVGSGSKSLTASSGLNNLIINPKVGLLKSYYLVGLDDASAPIVLKLDYVLSDTAAKLSVAATSAVTGVAFYIVDPNQTPALEVTATNSSTHSTVVVGDINMAAFTYAVPDYGTITIAENSGGTQVMAIKPGSNVTVLLGV